MDTQQQRVVAGRYRLLSSLGEGGMGTVWRAHDELLGREVAVKEVSFPHGLSDADRDVLRERTRREARAAARLDHPNAVTVFDVVEEDGLPYLVMELVEARTLAQVVRDEGPLAPRAAAEVGLALLGALETAHRQGVLHRDVKPSNVMLTDAGRVVLTDFGIATSTGDAALTHTGMLLGSPAYIAPERLRGQPLGPPSDLWSLGATLFTAVEGRPPFAGDDPLVTVTAVATGEHAPYALAGPLEPALEGLLTKDPDQRLDAPSARRLLERARDTGTAARTQVLPVAVVPPPSTSALDLGEVRAAAEPAAAPAAPRQVARPALRDPLDRPRRRPGWVAPIAVGAALLATAGAGYALTADDPGTTTATPTTSRAPSASAEAPAGPSTEPSSGSSEPSQEDAPAPVESPEPETAAGVPAGWSTDSGEAGWTVALPPGYEATGGGEYVQAATGRTLRVETGEGRADAVKDREQQAKDFERRHPTYEEIRIDAADYRGYDAADWEFTYEGLHVLNRVFVVDGVGHSLFFQTPEADFPAAQAEVERVFEAFRAVGE